MPSPSRSIMWFAYRFMLDDTAVHAIVQRDLDNRAHAFSEAILSHFHGEGHWVAASARAHDGGLDIWYNLPQRPTDADFAAAWEGQLKAHGLVAQRVNGRN